MDELTLVRLHVEAGWGVRVPSLSYGDVELAEASLAPEWELYSAELTGGYVRIWRRGVGEADRNLLAGRIGATEQAYDDGVDKRVTVRREVALARRMRLVAVESVVARQTRRLGPEDEALLDRFEPGQAGYYLAPERNPVVGVVVEGRILSVAHSSRRTAEACELGVETRKAARRRGYGMAVTRGWADAVESEGRVPLYSAMATNAASLALAASAGYRAFARATYGWVTTAGGG